jgi:hypothetical protein
MASSPIIIATSCISACTIGGKIYSGTSYGDAIFTGSDEVILKGSTNGNNVKVMHQAYPENLRPSSFVSTTEKKTTSRVQSGWDASPRSAWELPQNTISRSSWH